MCNNHPNHSQSAEQDPGDAAPGAGEPAHPHFAVFRCVNGSRSGTASAPGNGQRLSPPEPEWPLPVHEIALPCTGRLQPEHLLKAFEAGADAVCIIACAGDNCHYLEGSRRAERRVEYVRQLLDEIGLGGERLMVFPLADSAPADGTLGGVQEGSSRRAQLNGDEAGSRAALCDMLIARLDALQPNPLGQGGPNGWPRNGARQDNGDGSANKAG